ncbi:VOC family protein [Nocardiopsis sp. YSL2]|uniref:VOC family protein n=1 Tax=Nocardiopsis sp. YSL2 TaxID=2939492 RepID=UPI0026F45A8F|nr:VOC family protein [Nocardiopsis sp. YSL2]
MTRLTFMNLPVRDIGATHAFWASLGFSFNPEFSDEKALCMIVSDASFVMLLEDSFFRSFLPEGDSIAAAGSELITAVSVGSRQEADTLAETASAAGGRAVSTMDESGMYSRMIADPDGHLWEFLHMDMGAADAS